MAQATLYLVNRPLALSGGLLWRAVARMMAGESLIVCGLMVLSEVPLHHRLASHFAGMAPHLIARAP